jgi:hypothetical protein
MALTLRTINFNHDPHSATTSALNIRRNRDFEVALPEYDSNVPRPARRQCAAYALRPTRNQTVFVRCRFEHLPATETVFEVKATGGGVLGEIGPRVVAFGGATSATVDFPLSNRSFTAVGRRDVTWQWWYRTRGGTWQALVATSHRIYLVLDLPATPWTQTFADRRNPWTDLLDHACVIAAGRRDELNVSVALTKAIYSNYRLRYDIVSGAPRYGFGGMTGSFRMTEWIQYVLEQVPPAGNTFCSGSGAAYNDFWIVNCYDAAASLGLMGKVTGARLDYHFHQPFGYLRFVRPIGRGKCNNPFYRCTGDTPIRGVDDASRTRFGNHAYTRLQSRNNFDACMKEWLSLFAQLILMLIYFIIWLVLLLLSFGTVNRTDLLARATGWLVNMSQSAYNAATNDTSTPAEAAAAGGSPVLCALDFRVT